MNISIVIATCNRCEHLRNVLNSLEEVTPSPEMIWEVIVVDNNSTDATHEVVNELIDQKIRNLRYLFEARQGKSFALNTGIAEAKGKIIAFVDDDAIISPGWLTLIGKEFDSDPSLAGLGGRVELYNQEDKPIAIRTSRKRFVLSRASFNARFIPIIGCNMAFAREVFEEVGGFDPKLGPGCRIAAGEDLDFLYKVCRHGLKTVYCPDIWLYHNHGRKAGAVDDSSISYLIGRGAFYAKHSLVLDRFVVRMALRETISLVRRLITETFSGRSFRTSILHMWFLLTGAVQYMTTTSPRPRGKRDTDGLL